jgi:hypothetical protein
MRTFVFALVAYLRAFFLPRHNLALEVAALRQQLAVFKRKRPRPKLNRLDRLFWIALRRIWTEVLIVVKPETVVRWHRAGFRLFWRWRSRPRRPGRPKVSAEIRHLIRRMKTENPTWGAPRIHGELAFLNNHREVIAAFDFFTVPSLTFRILYCFFVIEHDRRRILHFNATAARGSVAALPLPVCRIRPGRQIRHEVLAFLQASGIKAIRTSVRSRSGCSLSPAPNRWSSSLLHLVGGGLISSPTFDKHRRPFN